MTRHKIVAYSEYKDNLLIGTDGSIVKPNPNDRRISRAILLGWQENTGQQLGLTEREWK